MMQDPDEKKIKQINVGLIIKSFLSYYKKIYDDLTRNYIYIIFNTNTFYQRIHFLISDSFIALLNYNFLN